MAVCCAMDVPLEPRVIVMPSSIFVCGHFPLKAHRETASRLLARVLGDGGHVDFPTVTEICDQAEGDAEETRLVVQILYAALQGTVGGSNTSRQLKAVTIAHEFLYDELARHAMWNCPGMLDSLDRLHEGSHFAGKGPAAESIRLLTAEIRRHLFACLEKDLQLQYELQATLLTCSL